MLRSFAIHGGDGRLPDWDLLLTDLNAATMTEGRGPYGVIENAAAGIVGGLLAGSFDIRRVGRSGQYIAAGLAFGLIAAAWSRALA